MQSTGGRARKGTGMLRQRPNGTWEYRTWVEGKRRSFYGKTLEEAQAKVAAPPTTRGKPETAPVAVPAPVARQVTPRQRRGGLWEVRVPIDGKTTSFYGRTPEAAKQRAEDAINHGKLAAAERGTLAGWVATWLEGRRVRLKPQTWRRYNETLLLHVLPAMGGGKMKLDHVSVGDIEALRDALRAGKLGPTSQRTCMVNLGAALEDAQRRGLIATNPVRLVEKPRAVPRAKITLTRDQARRLLEAVRGTRLDAIVAMALATGMRQGEILGLHWRDVELDERRLHVRGSLGVDAAGRLVIDAPKTKAARRTLHPVPEVAIAALRRLPQGAADDPVFIGPGGGYMRGSNVLRDFKSLMNKAGLPVMTFHELRDTATTHMIEDGIPIHVVSRWLGHASPAVTLNTYAHVTALTSSAECSSALR
jgi:integrase